MAIYNEISVASNRGLWDVISTSTGTRTEPLTIAHKG